MHVCMIIMLKNIEYMVRLRSIMLESRVNMSYGKDYGFICTCITGSTKFPKFVVVRVLFVFESCIANFMILKSYCF